MLLYDWKKIYRKSGGSASRILVILRSMLKTQMPYSMRDPTYKYFYDDFSGGSFLVSPHWLVSHRFRWTDKEIASYIGLASFRNLGEYYYSQKITLDLSHSPLGIDAINHNRLLRIEGKQIHFYYEDYTGDKIKCQD